MELIRDVSSLAFACVSVGLLLGCVTSDLVNVYNNSQAGALLARLVPKRFGIYPVRVLELFRHDIRHSGGGGKHSVIDEGAHASKILAR